MRIPWGWFCGRRSGQWQEKSSNPRRLGSGMPSAECFPAVYAVNPQGMSPLYISSTDREHGKEGKINDANATNLACYRISLQLTSTGHFVAI